MGGPARSPWQHACRRSACWSACLAPVSRMQQDILPCRSWFAHHDRRRASRPVGWLAWALSSQLSPTSKTRRCEAWWLQGLQSACRCSSTCTYARHWIICWVRRSAGPETPQLPVSCPQGVGWQESLPALATAVCKTTLVTLALSGEPGSCLDQSAEQSRRKSHGGCAGSQAHNLLFCPPFLKPPLARPSSRAGRGTAGQH